MKKNTPKVSIIIPTYNRDKYIVKTLESVFVQTFTDYEVIVVDDGSTDNTVEVLRPYVDRITYIRKTNGGQGSARNVGIKIAAGEYVAFLDSDDLWLPEKLEIQVRYLDEHQDVGLVFSDAVIFYENDDGNNIETQNIALQHADLSFEKLFQSNFIANLTVMVKKVCIEDVGLFDESRTLIGGEDYEMWLRIAMKYKLGHIPCILAMYRQHADNLVGDDLGKVYSMHINVIQAVLAKNPDIPKILNLDLHDYFRNFYYCSGRQFYQNGIYCQAIEYLRKALTYNPVAPKALALFFLSLIGSLGNRKIPARIIKN